MAYWSVFLLALGSLWTASSARAEVTELDCGGIRREMAGMRAQIIKLKERERDDQQIRERARSLIAESKDPVGQALDLMRQSKSRACVETSVNFLKEHADDQRVLNALRAFLHGEPGCRSLTVFSLISLDNDEEVAQPTFLKPDALEWYVGEFAELKKFVAERDFAAAVDPKLTADEQCGAIVAELKARVKANTLEQWVGTNRELVWMMLRRVYVSEKLERFGSDRIEFFSDTPKELGTRIKAVIEDKDLKE